MTNLSRMIPDLQASLACEDVRLEVGGAHTIIGVVNVVAAPSLPIQIMKLCIWTRWSSGVGEFEQTTRLVAPDDETQIIPPAVSKFQLVDEESHATNVAIFGGIKFTQPGAHHVEILLDNHLKLRFPMRVMLPPPKPATA